MIVVTHVTYLSKIFLLIKVAICLIVVYNYLITTTKGQSMTRNTLSKMTVQMLIDELSEFNPNDTLVAHFYLTRKAKQSEVKSPTSWGWGRLTHKATEQKKVTSTRVRLQTKKGE